MWLTWASGQGPALQKNPANETMCEGLYLGNVTKTEAEQDTGPRGKEKQDAVKDGLRLRVDVLPFNVNLKVNRSGETLC